MDNWSRLFELLAEEATLWRESQSQAEQQLAAWQAKEITVEEAESYLTRQERSQSLLLQKQAEIEQLQAEIEATAEKLSAERQAELERAVQARAELQKLQAKLTVQNQELQVGLRSFGEKQRNLIRESRSRQAAQQTYQTVPLAAESALLDQKK